MARRFPSDLPPKEYFDDRRSIRGDRRAHADLCSCTWAERKTQTTTGGRHEGREVAAGQSAVEVVPRHGLELTKIHEMVEFRSQRCFKPFMNEVTDARRKGNADSSLDALASTMKLVGNSGFGSLIMDKLKHQDVKFVDSPVGAYKKVNEQGFCKVTEIYTDYLEVEMAKEKIKLDLPIQLGYWILQLGKL